MFESATHLPLQRRPSDGAGRRGGQPLRDGAAVGTMTPRAALWRLCPIGTLRAIAQRQALSDERYQVYGRRRNASRADLAIDGKEQSPQVGDWPRYAPGCVCPAGLCDAAGMMLLVVCSDSPMNRPAKFNRSEPRISNDRVPPSRGSVARRPRRNDPNSGCCVSLGRCDRS
jgi:hypothetical protein